MNNDKENMEIEDIQEACGEDQTPGEPELSPEEKQQKELDELSDRYMRLMAEYDNFRKRTQREKEELYGNATANTVEKFLPVWDNLQRALEYDPGSEGFAKGMELISGGFEDVLKGLGVETIGEVGESFDPNLHNAVSHIEDESLGENVISQVMQKGYRMGERVIRYAMVQTAN